MNKSANLDYTKSQYILFYLIFLAIICSINFIYFIFIQNFELDFYHQLKYIFYHLSI